MVNLSVTLCGIQMSNPIILASGVLNETGDSMLQAFKNGAGAVVTKSVGLKARMGHRNPSVVEVEHGILNALGLPNPGIDAYAEEIERAKSGGPLICSIYGKDTNEFKTLAKKAEELGVSGVEINLSCPHAGEYGAALGQDARVVRKITAAVKESVTIPLFVKLTPNVTSIVDIGRAAEDGGADALVAINTVKAMAINAEVAMPILANKIGGYSGPAIKPIGLRCVYELYNALSIPIVGVGGILTGEDAVEYIMAGASAVQVGSAVLYRGREVFSLIAKEMRDFMEEHGYSRVQEMVGLACRE